MVKAAIAEPAEHNGRDLAPLEGGNTIFAAWDMFYHIFGARANRFDVTPDGVFIIGLTLDEQFNLEAIIADTARYTHRLDLVKCYPWLSDVPTKPIDSLEISVWQAQWFGGAGGGKRGVPEYVRIAANNYRGDNSLGRGSKGNTLTHIDPANFDPELLRNIDPKDLIAFQDAISNVIGARAAAAAGA